MATSIHAVTTKGHWVKWSAPSRDQPMIPAGVQAFVSLEPVDMRFGLERLSRMVRQRMGYEPRGV